MPLPPEIQGCRQESLQIPDQCRRRGESLWIQADARAGGSRSGSWVDTHPRGVTPDPGQIPTPGVSLQILGRCLRQPGSRSRAQGPAATLIPAAPVSLWCLRSLGRVPTPSLPLLPVLSICAAGDFRSHRHLLHSSGAAAAAVAAGPRLELPAWQDEAEGWEASVGHGERAGGAEVPTASREGSPTPREPKMHVPAKPMAGFMTVPPCFSSPLSLPKSGSF